MAELEVRDLTVEFASGGYMVRPLDQLSFDAEDGQLVVVLGPSGCGKTTLLSCLAGLLTPTSGSISFRGTEVSTLAGAALGQYRRSTVGVVFQAFNLIPSLSARGNVMAPLRLARIPRPPTQPLGPMSCWPRSTCPIEPTTDPARCRAASSSAWRSPEPSCTNRPWWSQTSPPPTSITSRSKGFSPW